MQGLLFIVMCSLLIAMASLMQSTDSRLVGSVVEVCGLSSSGLRAHGLSCSMACGIFLDQESNLYLLHWQVDSLPLKHQGSPLGALEFTVGPW